MQTDAYLFIILAQRSARSIFGAATNPVMRNGKLLCFRTTQQARAERDRLHAGTGGSHVRYSVRPVHVQLKPAAPAPSGAPVALPPEPPLRVPRQPGGRLTALTAR